MKKATILLIAVISAASLDSAIWFSKRAWFSRPAKDAPVIEVRVTEGWSTTQIAYVLQEHGVIDSAFGYRLFSYIEDVGRKGKPGTYTLRHGDSYRVIAQALSKGESRPTSEIRITEGWDLRDITEHLRAKGFPPVNVGASSWRDEYDFLQPLSAGASLEGYLFPDTYFVYTDTMSEGLIRKQLDAFAKRAPRLKEEAAKQGKTLHEIVTLASIVEKEVAKPEDRKIVAGIFQNRLDIGMPLQSDATINYITRGGRTRPTYDDLASESPYNTYKVRGLPPTPISMPGDDALEAALFPAKTPYLYFLTDEQGNTYFAKTFEEHIQNRNKAFK